MDTALQADLGRASLPRLARAPDDLLARDEIRRAAQVPRQLAFRERAEAAAEVADVRVLDVPGDDVRHHVAAHLLSEPVRSREDALQLSTARLQQTGQLVLAQVVAGELERHRVASYEKRDAARLAGRPCIIAGEPDRVGGSTDVRRDGRIAPALQVRHVLGVDRQASGRAQPAAPGRLGQALDLGPRRLGIDVVDRHRRDAAPVVDTRVQQPRKALVREVRRRLHVPVGPEQDPRDRDRPQVVVEVGLGVRGHARARLRAEVLDDHLLQMPEFLAECAQGEQGVDPPRATRRSRSGSRS